VPARTLPLRTAHGVQLLPSAKGFMYHPTFAGYDVQTRKAGRRDAPTSNSSLLPVPRVRFPLYNEFDDYSISYEKSPIGRSKSKFCEKSLF
jgi:hypothetical protein